MFTFNEKAPPRERDIIWRGELEWQAEMRKMLSFFLKTLVVSFQACDIVALELLSKVLLWYSQGFELGDEACVKLN